MYHQPRMETAADHRIQHWRQRQCRFWWNLQLVAVLAALVIVASGTEGEASEHCVQAPQHTVSVLQGRVVCGSVTQRDEKATEQNGRESAL